jgi:DNA polymerase III subunit delta
MAILRESEIANFLKRQASSSAGLLVYGDDEALVQGIVRDVLRGVAAQEDIVRLSASVVKDDPAQLDDVLRSISFFGGRQAIVVDGCDDRHVKVLEPYISNPIQGHFLVLISGSLSKSSALRKATEEAPTFFVTPVYADSPSTILERVERKLHEAHLRFGEGAAESFMTLCGTDRMTALAEVEKLSLYCLGQTEISEVDVIACCGDQSSFAIDEVIDACLGGDAGRVDRMYTALDDGEWRSVLPLMSAHLARLLTLRLDVERLGGIESALRAAKPPIFFARKSAFSKQLQWMDSSDCLRLIESFDATVLQSRKLADLAPQIVGRTLLSLAVEAQRQLRRA